MLLACMVLLGLLIFFIIVYTVNYRILRLILPKRKWFLFACCFLALWTIEGQLASAVFGSGYYGHQPKAVIDFFRLAIALYQYWYWGAIVFLFVSAGWIRYITFKGKDLKTLLKNSNNDF